MYLLQVSECPCWASSIATAILHKSLHSSSTASHRAEAWTQISGCQAQCSDPPRLPPHQCYNQTSAVHAQISSEEPNSAASQRQACPSELLPKRRLCSTFLEPVIFETYADDFLCDTGVQSLNCKLQDKEQKSLVLAGPCVLKALHLLARDMNREGTWGHPASFLGPLVAC